MQQSVREHTLQRTSEWSSNFIVYLIVARSSKTFVVAIGLLSFHVV